MDKDEKIKRLEEALKEHMRFNLVCDDKDAYLYALAYWAFDETGTEKKPIQKDYMVYLDE